jgi:small membrane protein
VIAQLILTALLSVLLLYAWSQYRRSPAVGLLSLITSGFGLYFVWVPSHATKLAEWAGIGRGVDLIIYTWVAVSLIVLLNLHLKIRMQLELITQLARAIAILNASPTADPTFARPSPSCPNGHHARSTGSLV